MCGRTACTLDPDDLRCACAYTNRKGQRKRPQWRQSPSSRGGGTGNNRGVTNVTGGTSSGSQSKHYFPSTNISPQSVTPVLVSSKHFDDNVEGDEQLLTPMQWGLVPSWHKGDPSQVAYKMNNCRSEGMMGKSMYKRPFEKGRRCIVLADGYYEWKTQKGSKTKQPFFIYMPQADGKHLSELHIKPTNNETVDECAQEEGNTKELDFTPIEEEDFKEWTGHRLMAMAGIFDCWISPNDGQPLFTYTIITIDATSNMADIHHRMPVVLNGDDAIRDWLDFDTVPAKEALKLVKSEKCLQFHPVSSQVNNSRYKGLDCVKPIEIGKIPESKSSNLMTTWLKKSPVKKDTDTSTEKGSSPIKTAIKLEESTKRKSSVMEQAPAKQKKSMMDQWIIKDKSSKESCL